MWKSCSESVFKYSEIGDGWDELFRWENWKHLNESYSILLASPQKN